MTFRICLVSPLPPPYGGIGNWTVLVHRYAQQRDDVVLDIIDTAPRWRAIDDLTLWKRVIFGGMQLLRDYARLLNMIRRGPDVIHLATSGQLAMSRDIAMLATARLFRIPTVYHLHFGRIPQISKTNTREWRWLAKAIRMANTVIAIDPETATTIVEFLPDTQVVRIPNGIDLANLPLSEPKRTFQTLSYLGWVIPTKGMSELCQAWALIQSSLEGWRCWIIGPGSEAYKRELKDQFHLDHIDFIPEQSHTDALRLLSASDVFVLPSHTEGFPNVIIEAMAMGKPVIATSVGAIPEMLSQGCGVIVPPKNVEALGTAILHICTNTEMRNTMGACAQHKARTEYAMDKVFDQLMVIWREVSK